VLVAAKGTAGQKIKLELKNKAGNLCGEVNFTVHDGSNEQIIQLDTGARSDEYTLELSRIRGEITHSDNTFGFKVEVSEPKIHVLYMEGSNHTKYSISTNHLNLGTSSGGRRIWEYQFLEKAFLETGLIDVEVFTVNVQSSRGGRLYHVKDKKRGFPTTCEELFKYDVIICSDINRYIFTEEQLEWTVELVASRGGGFCMIGGKTSFGAGLWQETVWEQMIPVAMDTGEQDFLGFGFNPIFPDEVRNHPILQIDSDFSQNNEILDNHPRFRGANFVKRAKPGATVLAYAAPSKQYDTDDFHLYASSTSNPVIIRSIQSPQNRNTPVEERVPTICVQSYGKGRSMAFTSDAAGWWGDFYQTQWGKEGHDNRYYNKFWVNAVRWLAENSLARHRSKLVGNTESVNYKPGEVVRVRAQILVDEDTAKLQSNKVTAHLDLEASKSIELRFDPDRKEYLGDLRLPNAVEQSEVTTLFHATDSTDRLIGEDKIPIRVITLKKEFVDPIPDPHLLGEIARLTGGRTIKDQSDLRDLLRGNMNNKTMELRFYKVPLWDHPWLWGLLILLFGTEWIIRKVIRLR
jgi:uncharacterized membrane protein